MTKYEELKNTFTRRQSEGMWSPVVGTSHRSG